MMKNGDSIKFNEEYFFSNSLWNERIVKEKLLMVKFLRTVKNCSVSLYLIDHRLVNPLYYIHMTRYKKN